VYEGEALSEREFQLSEARRTDSSMLDIGADWIDYGQAGVANAEELDDRVVALLRAVDLEEAIFELGLRSTPDAARSDAIATQVLAARGRMHERLASLGIQEWVERFDPSKYIRNATLAENLLFGTPVGKTFDIENLAGNAYVRQVLRDTGMHDLILRMGHKVAETMVELFSGLPPGHEFFAQYSFIRQEDLPQFDAILKRVGEVGLRGLGEEESQLLLALPFKLICAKHRLGLIDQGFEQRVIEARRHFAANLPAEMRGAVEFFDPAGYNHAASLQDNILFGKIVTGQAEAGTRITRLLRELLEELGLRSLVVKIGLDYQVGVGGARLPVADRQKTALARAMLKRPALLVLDEATAVLDPAANGRVLAGILAERKGKGLLWVLQRPENAKHFGTVLVMERGRVVEKGVFEKLQCSGGPLHKMLQPA